MMKDRETKLGRERKEMEIRASIGAEILPVVRRFSGSPGRNRDVIAIFTN
jgi:hypothetical protein